MWAIEWKTSLWDSCRAGWVRSVDKIPENSACVFVDDGCIPEDRLSVELRSFAKMLRDLPTGDYEISGSVTRIDDHA